MNDEKATTREAEGQQRKRNSFVFYRSFVEAAGLLEQQERKSLIDAVISYGLDGVEPTFESRAVNVAWVLIKPQLDANWKKYENGRKGAPFGKMGGAPIGNTNASKTTPKQPQNNPKTTPNVNVNANVNANDNGLCSIKEQKPHNIESGGAFLKNAPAIDKIREYIEAGGLDVDADEFFEHYEDNGWVTKDGKPITNWRRLLRSWDKRKRQPDSDADTHDEAEADSEADSKPTDGATDADQRWQAFQEWVRQELPIEFWSQIGYSDYEGMFIRANGDTRLMAKALKCVADSRDWFPLYAEYDKALKAVRIERERNRTNDKTGKP